MRKSALGGTREAFGVSCCRDGTKGPGQAVKGVNRIAALLIGMLQAAAAPALLAAPHPYVPPQVRPAPVSYTHLTLPTNREV